jgi:hypothetical protein
MQAFGYLIGQMAQTMLAHTATEAHSRLYAMGISLLYRLNCLVIKASALRLGGSEFNARAGT